MLGEFIEIPSEDGQTFTAYHSRPQMNGAPVIVLCQEIFGVNLHIREVADQWASVGFHVLAPDLFWRLEPRIELGYEGEDLEHARGLYQRLDLDKARADVLATSVHGKGIAETNGRTGLLGFCFGGKLVYMCAAQGDPDCAIGYYGVGIEKMLDKLPKIDCPLLLHFGAEDAATPPEATDQIEAALSSRPDSEAAVYPGAQHGFNNWRKKTFNGPESQKAFAKSLKFARERLF